MAELTPGARHFLDIFYRAIKEGKSADSANVELVDIFVDSRLDIDAALDKIERV